MPNIVKGLKKLLPDIGNAFLKEQIISEDDELVYRERIRGLEIQRLGGHDLRERE